MPVIRSGWGRANTTRGMFSRGEKSLQYKNLIKTLSQTKAHCCQFIVNRQNSVAVVRSSRPGFPVELNPYAAAAGTTAPSGLAQRSKEAQWMKLRKLLAQLFRRNESICWDPGDDIRRVGYVCRTARPTQRPHLKCRGSQKLTRYQEPNRRDGCAFDVTRAETPAPSSS
jgi:hypothetical protein